jgi:hypothetical protein
MNSFLYVNEVSSSALLGLLFIKKEIAIHRTVPVSRLVQLWDTTCCTLQLMLLLIGLCLSTRLQPGTRIATREKITYLSRKISLPKSEAQVYVRVKSDRMNE